MVWISSDLVLNAPVVLLSERELFSTEFTQSCTEIAIVYTLINTFKQVGVVMIRTLIVHL